MIKDIIFEVLKTINYDNNYNYRDKNKVIKLI